MKSSKARAKYGIKFLVLVAILTLPLFLLAWPAIAPTLEIKNEDGGLANSGSGASFPAKKQSSIDDSQVKAISYLVYDEKTGTVLAERAPQNPVSIASLTKLMTAHLVLKYGQLSDTVTVQGKNVLNINPVLGLTAGDKVLVEDLLYSILIGSANDAAVSLGAYLETKQPLPIAQLMNNEADSLEMFGTQFNNPIGFDSDTNYSSAEDMKILIERLRQEIDFQTFNRSNAYSFLSLNNKNFGIRATNKLIASHPDIYAIKTGFTDDALGAMVTSVEPANKPEQSFVIIVLQSPGREQDTLTIKNEIMKAYFNNSQLP